MFSLSSGCPLTAGTTSYPDTEPAITSFMEEFEYGLNIRGLSIGACPLPPAAPC